MIHSAIASCATCLFLPHFDVIYDLLLNRRTATWNLFVNKTTGYLIETLDDDLAERGSVTGERQN